MSNLKKYNATIFYSYQICHREAWFYYHRLNPSQEHDLLIIGRLIHEDSYKRNKKEIMIDQLLKIDWLNNDIIAEVKKSSKHKKAAIIQLAYYLYYLKHEKDIIISGILLFPKEKKTEKIELTPELEKQIESLLDEMQTLLSKEKPPPPKRNRYCRSCSFREMCWA